MISASIRGGTRSNAVVWCESITFASLNLSEINQKNASVLTVSEKNYKFYQMFLKKKKKYYYFVLIKKKKKKTEKSSIHYIVSFVFKCHSVTGQSMYYRHLFS